MIDINDIFATYVEGDVIIPKYKVNPITFLKEMIETSQYELSTIYSAENYDAHELIDFCANQIDVDFPDISKFDNYYIDGGICISDGYFSGGDPVYDSWIYVRLIPIECLDDVLLKNLDSAPKLEHMVRGNVANITFRQGSDQPLQAVDTTRPIYAYNIYSPTHNYPFTSELTTIGNLYQLQNDFVRQFCTAVSADDISFTFSRYGNLNSGLSTFYLEGWDTDFTNFDVGARPFFYGCHIQDEGIRDGYNYRFVRRNYLFSSIGLEGKEIGTPTTPYDDNDYVNDGRWGVADKDDKVDSLNDLFNETEVVFTDANGNIIDKSDVVFYLPDGTQLTREQTQYIETDTDENGNPILVYVDPITGEKTEITPKDADGNTLNISVEQVSKTKPNNNYSFDKGILNVWYVTADDIDHIISGLWATQKTEVDPTSLTAPIEYLFYDFNKIMSQWVASGQQRSAFWNTMVRFGSLPFDITPWIKDRTNVFVGIQPVTYNDGVSVENLRLHPVADNFIELNFGTLDLNQYFGTSLDFTPNTSIAIYLPYIGFKKLNTNDVMQSTLTLVYLIDVITGNCVAKLKINKAKTPQGNIDLNGFIYNFSGNMYYDFPMNKTEMANLADNTARLAIKSAMTIGGLGVSVVSNASDSVPQFHEMMREQLNGRPEILASDIKAVQQRQSALQSEYNERITTPDIQSTALKILQPKNMSGVPYDDGTYSASIMQTQYPYLMIYRPIVAIPKQYGSLIGYPSGVSVTLGDIHGMFIVDKIRVDIDALPQEINMIEQLLKTGVYNE